VNLTPRVRSGLVLKQKRDHLLSVVARVEANKQEIAAMKLAMQGMQKRAGALEASIVYDLRLLEDAARRLDDEPGRDN
jgi:hypothetical protein